MTPAELKTRFRMTRQQKKNMRGCKRFFPGAELDPNDANDRPIIASMNLFGAHYLLSTK